MSSRGSSESPGEFAALAELAEAFAVLVRALAGDGPISRLSPRQIVELAARCVPHGQHAALTVRQDDRTETLAAMSEVSERISVIRREVGEGPTLDVLDTNDLVVSNDLGVDPRWPVYGRRVVDDVGIRSTVSYRLYLERRSRGALTLYSDWPHAFDNLAITTGASFAAYCSLSMLSERVFDEPVTQRRAAQVHREIGVAVGLLMAAGDLSTQAAYDTSNCTVPAGICGGRCRTWPGGVIVQRALSDLPERDIPDTEPS